ncbi:hypothetical protein BTA51_13850 [Hahella sp. CCB-MM4]|uniref:putative adhesin n=1 Tax=Hahella sp. (strain CCB-MM4) TaxID=1926491 RepID=UPI000B9BE161|nr:hypothetical protein [Hahella sp. CCB-MM4]OZG73032.1 hypothetical protein BTA51_13850 [Hahella sp. CCB-MM4]
MAKKTPLGDKLYLFTDDTGMMAENLLITSHGGYIPRPDFGKQTGRARKFPGLGGWIGVPEWTQLYLYGPHTKTLLDPGLNSVISGKTNYLQRLQRNEKIRNYSLGKYQGDDTGETYESISRDIDNNRTYINLRQEAMDSGDEGMIAHVQRLCPNPFPKFDVLTVRNRKLMSGVNLKHVLDMLASTGYRYTNIHCVFCRSRMIGTSGTWNAANNP